MEEYLRIDSISKTFGEHKAVDNISLSVPRGAIYGIIGPNGAGKTTTIRMIMDIIAPDKGSIFVNGQKVTIDFKNKVGYLPEERGLYKKMTLEEVIIFFAQIKNYPKAKILASIDQWLERMNLHEYKKKKVEELSKGMQQKLQFITTLIHEPDLIILDELFSGLDPINIELIKDIVLEQKECGRTILFSTNVIEQAEKLCDFICLINKGQKVLDGRLNDIKKKFGTNSLQIEIDGDGSFISSLEGVKDFIEFPNYIELELGNNANIREIITRINEKVDVKRFEIMEPSLYDIFIKTAKIDPNAINEEGAENE